uniref:Uncharacterized protein n=1 Tax=Oryza sativa subsp. japonica TaxID=39947 RepID=Q8S5E7_ORYSJ|nr:Hypothetical protein [Oryza sativa Japonica Group]
MQFLVRRGEAAAAVRGRRATASAASVGGMRHGSTSSTAERARTDPPVAAGREPSGGFDDGLWRWRILQTGAFATSTKKPIDGDDLGRVPRGQGRAPAAPDPSIAAGLAKAETRRRREPAFFAHGLHRLPFRCRLELLPTPSRLALADLLRVGELYGGANVLRPRRRPPFRLRPLAAARSPPSSTLVWQLIPHLQIYPRDGGKQRGRDLRGALRHAGSGKELGLWGQPGRGKRAGRLGGQMGAEQRSASPCINSFGSNSESHIAFPS